MIAGRGDRRGRTGPGLMTESIPALLNRHRTQIYLIAIITLSSFLTWNMFHMSLQAYCPSPTNVLDGRLTGQDSVVVAFDVTEQEARSSPQLVTSSNVPGPGFETDLSSGGRADPMPTTIESGDDAVMSNVSESSQVPAETLPDQPTQSIAAEFSDPEPIRTPSPTDLYSGILQWRYHQQCQTGLPFAASQYDDLIGQIEAQDEFSAVQVGYEMWNRLSLEEVQSPYRYYADQGAVTDTALAYPLTILSYGQRREQGLQQLERIGAHHTDLVSYPSLDAAFHDRPYLSRYLFRNAINMEWDRFTSFFSGKDQGYLLSTLNQWIVLERLKNGTYPDEVFVVEDDVFMVPDFQRKFGVLREQLATLPWEVVFVGTCHQIKSDREASSNLFVADASRCFNAVLLRRSAAVKILEAGAVLDEFQAVDHMFNIYIPTLNLTAYYVYPPLAYEQTKISHIYPC